MKKVNLNNLYESPNPPTDINTLWVDKDETTGKMKAIHKYNKAKGEWEPYMASTEFMGEDVDSKEQLDNKYFPIDTYDITFFKGILDGHGDTIVMAWKDMPSGLRYVEPSDNMNMGNYFYTAMSNNEGAPYSIGNFVTIEDEEPTYYIYTAYIIMDDIGSPLYIYLGVDASLFYPDNFDGEIYNLIIFKGNPSIGDTIQINGKNVYLTESIGDPDKEGLPIKGILFSGESIK